MLLQYSPTSLDTRHHIVDTRHLSWISITDSNMENGLQLGSDLLQVGSQIMDLTWSNKDPSNKAVSIFETVINQFTYLCYVVSPLVQSTK